MILNESLLTHLENIYQFCFVFSFFMFLLFALFSLLVFPSQAVSKTLHAILVADTVHEIRSVTEPDLYKWQEEVRSIARHTRMTLREKIFSGENFNKEKIKEYLVRLKVNSSDSLIFYFSGHGYRTMQKKTAWPFLTFQYYQPGLDVAWVVKTIRAKRPQFALVMSDCCNNFMENGMFGKETKNIVINLKKVPLRGCGYEQLFCKAKGCVVVSSCSKGQFSYGSRMGGLYTQCFFSSLRKELRKDKPSWKLLLQRTNGLIKHIQLPICEILK